MTEDDRQALADLALRALDTIVEDYGEDAQLCAASLVFEVKTVDEVDGEPLYHTNYKSLAANSPSHIAGLLGGAARYINTPYD